MLRACQTAEAVLASFARPEGAAPPSVFVRRELMEVHGPLLAEDAGTGGKAKKKKVYSSAARSTRSWAAVLSEHSGFQRWPAQAGGGGSGSADCDNFGWCGTDEVETQEAATVRAEELLRELKSAAQNHQAGSPTQHIVLVTHAIFIGCFTQAVFGHPVSQYNAAVTKLKITRCGNIQCEFANSVLHLATRDNKDILPKGVGGGLL
jgi:broad specificity phosphatase PhoE